MQVSIWEKETFFAPQDVIIIGSGFVGLWSAFFLKRKNPHLQISIVERGLIPTGASTRNAGFACFGSLSEVVHDAQKMGTDKMLELVEMRFKGLERIQKFFPDTQIDFNLCGGYELYDDHSVVNKNALLDEIHYINSLLKPITGSKNTYKLDNENISSYGFGNTSYLVKNNLEGYLHSGKLLQSLLQKVQSMGVQVFNGVEVKEFVQNNQSFNIENNQGLPLSCRQILLCTNAFTKNLFPEIDIIPVRGQVLLTSPIDKLPWKGTFHSDEGYYYFRNLGNRVLLGGARNMAFEEETTTTLNTSELIQSHLEAYLSNVVLPNYRGSYTIDHRWSGIMAMGSEKLPIVKELNQSVFCAVRMSGMGVALAPVVGQKIAKQMIAAL
jgi:glycine/D-amino acid oxidase-like deaminating enzyme